MRLAGEVADELRGGSPADPVIDPAAALTRARLEYRHDFGSGHSFPGSSPGTTRSGQDTITIGTIFGF